LGNAEGKAQFIENWRNYVQHLKEGKISSLEQDIMEFLADCNDAQVVLHILWAKFGQVIEEVQGIITDILPSRLRALANTNKQANNWTHALRPKVLLDNTRFDLPLSILFLLFRRPGKERAKNANASQRLFELKRQLAAALYHGTPLGRTAASLWDEILTTARFYLDDIATSGYTRGLLHEDLGGKGKNRYLTLAGWIRHLSRFFYYLDITGVLPMESQQKDAFEPEMERLKPYFQPGSGINSPEKAFAFLLGILYGKLLEVQSARGVNVASNALTWLKRLKLSGRGLPAFYNKIREKLLAYGTEGSREVRLLIHDIGRLGACLGDRINLDNTSTCYFLLLGQSITVEVLPSKDKENKGG
jgi:CRISPR-associated protein Csh1